MDIATQEELKLLEVLGIFTKSFKTLLAWKNIFSKITLSLILPLAIVFIVHMEISHRFYHEIEENPFQLFFIFYEYYRYNLSKVTPTDWLYYLFFKTDTITIITLFYVLSTAAVVFITVSIFTGGEVTYGKVMKVIPKVWERLSVTFLCMLFDFFVYNLIYSVVFFLLNAILTEHISYYFVLVAICIHYIIGFSNLAIVWQLASVVSVLESCYGQKAKKKAVNLVKGKGSLSLQVSYLLYSLLILVVAMYLGLVLFDLADLKLVWRIAAGVLSCVLFMIIFLLLMVAQTVLYLVCKLDHGEAIDKVSISTLGASLSDSQPASIVSEDIHHGGPPNQPVSQV